MKKACLVAALVLCISVASASAKSLMVRARFDIQATGNHYASMTGYPSFSNSVAIAYFLWCGRTCKNLPLSPTGCGRRVPVSAQR